MQNPIKRLKGNFLIFVVRFVPAYIIVLSLFHVFGPYYTKMFLPSFTYEAKWIFPEYQNEFSIDEEQRVFYSVRFVGDFEDERGKHLAEINAGVNIPASTLYIHPIIIFSLLLAWPNLHIKNRLKATVVALPLLVTVSLIDIPLTLIYLMEKRLVIDPMAKQIRNYWVYFLFNGGRQFLSILIFLVSIAPFHLTNSSVIKSSISRNAPCPCGSGKKYEKCCLNQANLM